MRREVIFYAERVSLNLREIGGRADWGKSVLYKHFLDMLESTIWESVKNSPADRIEITISCYEQD